MASLIPRAGLATLVALCVLGAGRVCANGSIEYTEVNSSEVAVLNSAPAFTYVEAVSREAALYNSEPSVAYAQAYSREAPLYNSEPALSYREAFSKESVTYVSEISIVDSFSREAVVFNGYHMPEAMDAIRIAGGFQAATPAQVQRFQLALQLAAQGRVSLPVAAAILRIAIRLQ